MYVCVLARVCVCVGSLSRCSRNVAAARSVSSHGMAADGEGIKSAILGTRGERATTPG